MRKIYFLCSLLILITSVNGESINISQIDSSSLLFNQKVDLYLQVTDDSGNTVKGLTGDDFIVSESNNDSSFYNSLEIVDFKEGINKVKGINFLLLIDNSGSMYRTIEGEDTDNSGKQRITIAKRAIRNFVANSIDVKDTISLASFNSFYTFHSTDIRGQGLTILDLITEPSEEYNKTELYYSLQKSIDAFSRLKGRKVVIVLSDGANVPRDESVIYKYEDTIREYQKEGISVYAINFAGEADKKLVEITSGTGGNIFEASDSDELLNIYENIKSQILKEYLITYRATMESGNRRYVRVSIKDGVPVTRVYFSSTVFGTPGDTLSPLLIILPFFAILLTAGLWFFKFEKLNELANIEILQSAPGVTISDDTIALSKGKTVIGGSNSADLTIAGENTTEDEFATIVYDDKTANFKIVSSKTVMVNNQLTTDKTLEAGDVINIDGTTIVFDDEIVDKN